MFLTLSPSNTLKVEIDFLLLLLQFKGKNNLGLGRTVSELEIGDAKPFAKTLFSMCTPDVTAYMKEKAKGTFHHRRQTKIMKLF